MTLEHVQDPGALVAAAHRLLRPGGAFVGVTHNRRAWLNRMLVADRRSSTSSTCSCSRRRAQPNLLTFNGYADVGGVELLEPLPAKLLVRLVPMSRPLKGRLTGRPSRFVADQRRIPLNVGNFMSWGFKA